MSKLLDDFVGAIPQHPHVNARVSGMLQLIAERIVAANGDPVRLSDLAAVLREDPDAVGVAVAKDPPEAAQPQPQPEPAEPADPPLTSGAAASDPPLV